MVDKIEFKNGSIITGIDLPKGSAHRSLRAYIQMIRNDIILMEIAEKTKDYLNVDMEESIRLLALNIQKDIESNIVEDKNTRGQRRDTSILEYDKYGTLDTVETK